MLAEVVMEFIFTLCNTKKLQTTVETDFLLFLKWLKRNPFFLLACSHSSAIISIYLTPLQKLKGKHELCL